MFLQYEIAIPSYFLCNLPINAWNRRVVTAEELHRKVIPKIKILCGQEHSEHQTTFYHTPDIDDTKGVIYCAVHIPHSKCYVGQTINSAFCRLREHWWDRSKGDHRNASQMHI
jgi:hypothetical protein